MCQNGWFRDASTAKSRDRLGVRALSNRRFSLLCFHNVYTDGRRYKLKNQPPRNESLQRLPVVVSRCSIAFVVEARAHKRITIRYSAAFHRSRCRTLLVSRDDRTTHDDNIYKGGTVTSKPKLLRSVICHVLLRKIASFITTYVSTDRDNASLLKRDTETSSALTHTHTHAFSSFFDASCAAEIPPASAPSLLNRSNYSTIHNLSSLPVQILSNHPSPFPTGERRE